MSEKEKNIIEETEAKEPIFDIVGKNVALLKSKIIGLESLVEELTEKLDEVTTKYEQARDFIDDDAKSDLLAYISPRYDMSKDLLVLKTADELKEIKDIIDKVEIPVFKAGTKMTGSKKASQRALLESTFDRDQAKRMGGNK